MAVNFDGVEGVDTDVLTPDTANEVVGAITADGSVIPVETPAVAPVPAPSTSTTGQSVLNGLNDLASFQLVDPFNPLQAAQGIADKLNPIGARLSNQDSSTESDGGVPASVTNAPKGYETDITPTNIPVQEYDPRVQAPAAPGSLTAADLPDPEAPGLMEKKVGTDTETTSKTTPTAGSKEAIRDLKASGEKAEEAADEMAKSAGEAATIEADQQEAMANVDAKYNALKAEKRAEGIAEVQSEMLDLKARIETLANTKAETFWGSKTNADKIAAAISVGLGSFGGALLGNGQNVGTVLLQRQMDEFDKNQRLKFDRQKAAIDASKTSIDTKVSMLAEIQKQYDAEQIAARDRVIGQYAKRLHLAKTPGVQAKIKYDAAAFQKQVADSLVSAEARYDQQVTKQKQVDIVKELPRAVGMTRDGKPLNGEQSKALGQYTAMRDAEQAASSVDLNDPEIRAALTMYARDLNSLKSTDRLPFGYFNTVDGVMNMVDSGMLDKLAKRSPAAYEFVQRMNTLIGAKLRYDSGAAINQDEYLKEFRNFVVDQNDTADMIKEKQQRRLKTTKAMFMATGL